MRRLLLLLCLVPGLALAQPPSTRPRELNVDANGNITPTAVNGNVLKLPLGSRVYDPTGFVSSPVADAIHGLAQFDGGGYAYRDIQALATGEIDDAIVGKTTANSPIFSTFSHTGSGTYVRSTTSWPAAAGVDLTCVSVYNNGTYPNAKATAISPRHVLLTHHGGGDIANGSTLRFVTNGNVVVTRTLTTSTRIGVTDMRIGILDSDLPSTIKFARTLSAAQAAKFNSATPVLYFDQNFYAYIADTESVIGQSTTVAQSADAERAAFWHVQISGDSSNPAFFILDKTPVILFQFETSTAGPSVNYGTHRNSINSTMTSLGGGYQLTDFELTVFPSSVAGLTFTSGVTWDGPSSSSVTIAPGEGNEGIYMSKEDGSEVFLVNATTGAITSAALGGGSAAIVKASTAGLLSRATAGTDYLAPAAIGVTVQAQDTELGQIAALADPNADRILFWDDSAGAYVHLQLGTNLAISGTTLNASSGTTGLGSFSEWNAKGDLAVGTADNTAGILTVGANNRMLMADSAETTGLKWATPAVVKAALDLEIGTDVQAWDSALDTLAAAAITSFSASVLESADEAEFRNNIAAHTTIQFQDEGVNLGTGGTATSMNFVGTGVTATRSTNAITVTIDPAAISVATDTLADAKGDLIGGTADNTFGRLAVGANDTYLVADSTQTTGLKWAALDSDIVYRDASNSWSDGIKQTFNPNGTNAGVNVGAHTADPSSLANGDIWYDSTNNTLDARINGATVSLGAGGGGSVDDTAFASSWNGVTSTAPSKNVVYDWGHTFDTDDDGLVNALDAAATGTNPIFLAPNAAMGALEIDVTKKRNTKTSSANTYTLTFSATPSAGQPFGIVLTNGDSTADVVTLPANCKRLNGDALASFTLAGSASAEISFVYDGTSYWVAGEPITINDLTTKASPTTSDSAAIYSVADAADAKVALSNILGVTTKSTSSSYTIGTTDTREAYGGVIYVTGAATITVPAVANRMSFTVITVGAVAVSVDPNAADMMYLDGTALSDGDKATNTSTTGDMLVCTSLGDGTGWYCASGSNDGDPWTDGN